MVTQSTSRWHSIAFALVAALIAACDSGPGESEFVTACLKEGQMGANLGMGKAMGIDRDKFCQCSAKTARAAMSENGRRLMVWEMQGDKRQEIAALQSKMTDAEKMAVMKAGFEVFGKCAPGAR